MDRKSELLKFARESRILWVNENLEKNDMDIQSKDLEKLKNQFPIADTVQEVLNVYDEIINDGDRIDFDSILAITELDSEYDEDINDFNLSQFTDNLYVSFIRKLRHPLSKDIVNSMRHYVSKLKSNMKSEDISSFNRIDGEMNKLGVEIWNYLENLFEMMKDNPLWSSQTGDDWETSKIFIEKFLHEKLYLYLFSITAEEKMLDQKLHMRINSLAFLLPEHLDLHMFRNHDYKESIKPAIDELQKMMDAKCPMDKLIHLKSCTQAIYKELTALDKLNNKRASVTAGADVFLPIMILCVKEMNPLGLQSTINYIRNYTHPSKLVSEYGYLFTYFVSAVQFLEGVDAAALTISPEEFQFSIRRCKEDSERRAIKKHEEPFTPARVSALTTHRKEVLMDLISSARSPADDQKISNELKANNDAYLELFSKLLHEEKTSNSLHNRSSSSLSSSSSVTIRQLWKLNMNK